MSSLAGIIVLKIKETLQVGLGSSYFEERHGSVQVKLGDVYQKIVE